MPLRSVLQRRGARGIAYVQEMGIPLNLVASWPAGDSRFQVPEIFGKAKLLARGDRLSAKKQELKGRQHLPQLLNSMTICRFTQVETFDDSPESTDWNYLERTHSLFGHYITLVLAV